MPLLLLGITLGLDSFKAGIGLAALRPSWRRQAILASSFGIFDGLGTFAGLTLGSALTGPIATASGYLGPSVLIGYGLLLIFASRETPPEPDIGLQWMVVGVPLAFSVDNFVSGVALGLVQFPAPAVATIIGAISGVMALAGLRLGATAVGLFRLSPAWTGTMMLVIGLMLTTD